MLCVDYSNCSFNNGCSLGVDEKNTKDLLSRVDPNATFVENLDRSWLCFSESWRVQQCHFSIFEVVNGFSKRQKADHFGRYSWDFCIISDFQYLSDLDHSKRVQ